MVYTSESMNVAIINDVNASDVSELTVTVTVLIPLNQKQEGTRKLTFTLMFSLGPRLKLECDGIHARFSSSVMLNENVSEGASGPFCTRNLTVDVAPCLKTISDSICITTRTLVGVTTVTSMRLKEAPVEISLPSSPTWNDSSGTVTASTVINRYLVSLSFSTRRVLITMPSSFCRNNRSTLWSDVSPTTVNEM